MVPRETNRTNYDPCGWAPEDTTAPTGNCRVSATARENPTQKWNSDDWRDAPPTGRDQMQPGILRLRECRPHFKKPTFANQMSWKLDARFAPRNGQRQLARPRPKNTDTGSRNQMRKSWQMVKAVLLAALVHAAQASPALAQDARVSVGMTGIGSMSCAHWRSTKEHLAEGTVWIYGFWTGLNYAAAASDQAQSGTDTAEIVAEVKKTCAQLPSRVLASAVWTSYLEFNKR
jgi:hypothetical protein